MSKTKILLIFSLVFASFRLAAEEDPFAAANDDSFRDVAGELRCPTCTGLSVLESDAGFSVQIKDQVKVQMDEGKSKAEILDFFVERYGPWILREPPKTGFNMVAWAVPFGVLIFGPIVVWFFVWRKRKVVATFGVRSADDILTEMKSELERLKGVQS